MSRLSELRAEFDADCVWRREQRRLRAQLNRQDDLSRGLHPADPEPQVIGLGAQNNAWPGHPHIFYIEYLAQAGRRESDGQPPKHIPHSTEWDGQYAVVGVNTPAEMIMASRKWDLLVHVYQRDADAYIERALEFEASMVSQVQELRNASYEELESTATLYNVDADGVVEHLAKKNDTLRRKSASQREAFEAEYKAKLEDL